MAFNKAKTLQEAERLVLQGKISQGIRQYFDILDRDPSDITVLNTIGDLYVRERNIAEGLKQFYRLAEAYVQEGFILKAIAIYKKIIKLEPNPVGSWLRLAELYHIQGLSSEAREQYYQAAEFFKKRNQDDKALETLRKVVQLDEENVTARANLAAFCEQIGRKEEATQIYLETAEQAHRRGDAAAAQAALVKAQEIDPENPQLTLLRARQALADQRPEEVEKILSALPKLNQDRSAQALLIESYLSTRQIEKAEKVVLEVFNACPADFTPLASFVSACLEASEFDAAFRALSVSADELVKQNKASSLLESLRLIWSKSPQHIPTLELICRIYGETGEESALPATLEALGQSYEQSGQLEKAEQVFQKLLSREPENEHYKVLLHQVLEKQGKEILGRQREAAVTTISPASEERLNIPPASPALNIERQTRVRDALEDSDFFLRYHLLKKAVTELEEILEIYPDEVEIHKRLVEICWKQMPERAGQAAQAAVDIYCRLGDIAGARRFEQLAARLREADAEVAAPQAIRQSGASTETGPPSPPAPPATRQIEPASAFLPEAVQRPKTVPTGPPATPLNLPQTLSPTSSATQSVPSSGEQEIDLSDDWRSLQGRTAAPSPAPAPPHLIGSFNYEDSLTEIKFYLENGFVDEARKTVEELGKKFPDNPRVGKLRALIGAETGAPASAGPVQQPGLASKPASRGADASLSKESISTAPVMIGDAKDTSGFLAELREAVLESEVSKFTGKSPLDHARPSSKTGSESIPRTPEGGPDFLLGDLLEEIDDAPATGPGEEDDPETHYQLGVAFREMNLLDEAIGEFQKVVKGAGEGPYPSNFMQACTLLAICFMEKGLAPVAVKWYRRALETPGLDEEVLLALQYDLGVAYEQAGDVRSALEKFTEVYGQNIDFRDVAEKVRLYQQKLS